jgi:hypothetical protein
MRVGGILWGRRPPSAGGGPVLKRRPALRAGRRSKRKFITGNGITSYAQFPHYFSRLSLASYQSPQKNLEGIVPAHPPTFFLNIKEPKAAGELIYEVGR